MFVAAIRCDICHTAHEIPCRKMGDKPDVPEGWAVVTPMIRIKGTPQGDALSGWCNIKNEFDEKKVKKEVKEKKKLYDKRRDDLRAKLDKTHICPDCIEEIHTGKKSIKIGAPDGSTSSERSK
jgi:hypothetical protein